MWDTPIQQIEENLYVKRDDLLPYSFGGSKVREGFLYFDEIERGGYDCVVTYGSSRSNHGRVIANLAAARGMRCRLLCPAEASEPAANQTLLKLFGAEIRTVPVDAVKNAIEQTLTELRAEGKKPFFIPGGGHGKLGTEASVQCYEEIRSYETRTGVHFDRIFLASGTGTTQAGLVCGQILHGDDRRIIGISIARKNPRGRNAVLESVREYLPDADEEEMQEKTIFLDDYTGGGYGKECGELDNTIREALIRYGIPLDQTYTAKAFLGMKKVLEKERIENEKILFIHTGGTPLFFDDMEKLLKVDDAEKRK